MKIMVIANPKGGVAKTRTVLTLADWLAAEDNKSVLVVDVDQQTSASKHLVRNYTTVHKLVRGASNIGSVCLDLLAKRTPGSPDHIVVRKCGQIQLTGGISLIPASYYLDAL